MPICARTRRGDAALLAELAAGRTLTDAAATAGISMRTAIRRMQDAGFQRQLRDAQAETIGRAVARLGAASAAAVAVLASMLAPDKPDVIRVRAATGILDQLVRLRSAVELEQRVADLEQRLTDEAPARTWGRR
jgi:hypothetical protein